MRLSPLTFRLHRWLGWIVGLQVLAWIAGGLLFAWLPFEPWVKGQAVAQAPALQLPADWAQRAAAAAPAAALQGLQAVRLPQGAALKLRHEGETRWLLLDGRDWQEPEAAAIAGLAREVYRGEGRLLGVERLAQLPRRLLIVDEVGGRTDLWQARFDDGLRTRLYFDGRSGEYLFVRTEAWVWFDFFWRLHIMDYGHGHDFNGGLLRAASVLALALSLAGLLLALLALRRQLRTRRMKA